MAISVDQVASAAAETPPPAMADAPAPPMTDAAAPPAGEAVAGLSDELLQIPAIQGLLIGSPPATYAPVGSKFPEIEIIERNGKSLVSAGIGGYITEDKKNHVLFNSLYLKPEELIKADKEGKLNSVAAPFEQLNADMAEAFEGAPEAAPEAAPAVAAAPVVESQPDAEVQNRLATTRMQNSTPGGPTSGPKPGAGRVLNNILKQAV